MLTGSFIPARLESVRLIYHESAAGRKVRNQINGDRNARIGSIINMAGMYTLILTREAFAGSRPLPV